MNAFVRQFRRNVELRIIAQREEMMATARPESERFASPETREANRKLRRRQREDEITRRAQAIRAARPELNGNQARAEAHREMAREAKEDARAAVEERERLASQVVALVLNEGLTMRQVAERLGLEDEKRAYAEWKWATRRRAKL